MTANRRDFLNALAAAGLVAWGLERPRLPQPHRRSPLPAADKPGAKDTILVVIELTGGNDGLNTVIPFKDPEYAKLRPTLKLSPGPDQEDQRSARPASVADRAGRAAAGQRPVHRAGRRLSQPEPVALPLDGHLAGGQPGRGRQRRLARQGAEGAARRAVVPPQERQRDAPLALNGAPVRVPSISTLEEFQLQVAAASGADKKDQRDDHRGRGQVAAAAPACSTSCSARRRTPTPAAAACRRSARTTSRRRRIPNTALANRLKLAAQLIDAGLGAAHLLRRRIDNFDTHASAGAGARQPAGRSSPAP